MQNRQRIDDRTALIDWCVAHGTLAIAIVVVVVGIAVPALRGAVRGAAIIGALGATRLFFHPLRFVHLSRVWIERGQVFVSPLFGRTRAVSVERVEHDGHSPWPCVLHLQGGGQVSFVARRDEGWGALFDLEVSDRARYERPSDARDSLTDLELQLRR